MHRRQEGKGENLLRRRHSAPKHRKRHPGLRGGGEKKVHSGGKRGTLPLERTFRREKGKDGRGFFVLATVYTEGFTLRKKKLTSIHKRGLTEHREGNKGDSPETGEENKHFLKKGVRTEEAAATEHSHSIDHMLSKLKNLSRRKMSLRRKGGPSWGEKKSLSINSEGSFTSSKINNGGAPLSQQKGKEIYVRRRVQRGIRSVCGKNARHEGGGGILLRTNEGRGETLI